jgi:hypothetical protein
MLKGKVEAIETRLKSMQGMNPAFATGHNLVSLRSRCWYRSHESMRGRGYRLRYLGFGGGGFVTPVVS